MNESRETETLPTEMESTTFSQVVFIDVPRSYPPNTGVTCCYTVTAALQPHPRDWIGLFRVGWNTVQNYHTFVWVEPCLDRLGPETVRRQVVFNDYYLPRDDGDYQFCYVDNKGQVRGASTPFCFDSLQEQTLDTSLENDILVISTQEQTEQMEREKQELSQEVEQLKEDKQILKNELDVRLKEIHRLKLTIEELKNSGSAEAKPGCESTDVLMEQSGPEANPAPDFKQSQESLVQSLAPLDVKYEKALQKIQQLKQQRKELTVTTESQQAEITQLNSKMKEMEQDLSRLRDDAQLLQVDLQSSHKENKRLCDEGQQLDELKRDLEGLKKENETLHATLSNLNLQKQDEGSMKIQMEALLSQLQETRIQQRLEMQGANEARKRADAAEQELSELRCQLEQRATTESMHDSQCKDSSLEIKHKEALRTIDDQTAILDLAKEEQEELAKKNQELKAELELLRGELAHAKPSTPASPDPNPYFYPGFPSFPDPNLQDSLVFGNPYDISEGANEDKVPQCQHCMISFPGISKEELTQHEESHKVCPICTLICDEMEQQQFEDHVYTHDL